MPVPRIVQGASELARELGGWPSFHDAEVLELHLRREGESILALRLADPQRTVVEFVLTDVNAMELAEFNSQNVILDLDVGSDEDMVMIRLSPCFGVNGFIQAKRAGVRRRSGGRT